MQIELLDAFPEGLLEAGREDTSPEDLEMFQSRCTSVYGIGTEREQLMVLGLLPLSLLGRCTYLVLWVKEGAEFSAGLLRDMKREFVLQTSNMSDHFFAEAYTPQNERFLEFLGFTKLNQQRESVLYEWRG